MKSKENATKHEIFKKVHERAMKAIADGRVTKIPSGREEYNKMIERSTERLERIKKFKENHVPTNTIGEAKPMKTFEEHRTAFEKLKERAMKNNDK